MNGTQIYADLMDINGARIYADLMDMNGDADLRGSEGHKRGRGFTRI